VLDFIAKRHDNLEHRIYLSPEFKNSVRINAGREARSAALAATRTATSADTASKSAIAAAAACQFVVAATMKLTSSQRENPCKKNASSVSTVSISTLPQGVHPKTTAPCPATPERIRSYYDVRSSGQYANNYVPSCVATTCVQSTNYHSVPSSWPKQQ